MAILDSRVIVFSNESIRPVSEEIRALYYHCKAIKMKWDNEIGFLCPNSDTESLEDGRENEGVSRLNGDDLYLTMAQVNNVIIAFELPGVLNVIETPCVRPLSVQ